jgi:hypothetical protein
MSITRYDLLHLQGLKDAKAAESRSARWKRRRRELLHWHVLAALLCFGAVLAFCILLFQNTSWFVVIVEEGVYQFGTLGWCKVEDANST